MTRPRRLGPGRDVARLLADFGHDLPAAPAAARPGQGGPAVRSRLTARATGGGAGLGRVTGCAGVVVADDLGPGAGAVAADRHPRPAPDRGADGHRRAVRGVVLRRPVRVGPARRRPGHQPQRHLLRQTRPGQVRHHQGVPAADDGLRVPRPGPGRPQGRVRTAVRVLRGRPDPHRPRPASQDQPAVVRAAGGRVGHPGPARRAHPRRDRLRALAHPDPRAGRLPTHRRHPGAVRARGGAGRQGRPA